MSENNVDAMVKEAIRASKAGKKSEARALLEKATELDQFNEQAWIWLSAVVESEEDQRTCLENVLFINPGNEAARKGLDKLEKNSAKKAPPPPPPAKSSNPIATSSASASYQVEEPSAQEYDDWVNNLNIKPEAKPGGSASPFSDYGDMFDEDAFSDPFAQSGGFDDVFQAPVEEDYEEDFGDYEEDEEAEEPNRFGSSPVAGGPFASPSPSLDFGSSSRSSAPPPPVSSGRSQPASDFYTGEEDDEGEEGSFGFDSYGEEEDEDLSQADPSEYFDVIPADIRPTRLPGYDETYPTLVKIGLVVLVLANLAAAGMLAMTLMG